MKYFNAASLPVATPEAGMPCRPMVNSTALLRVFSFIALWLAVTRLDLLDCSFRYYGSYPILESIPSRIRTWDTRFWRPLLCQLS